MDKVVCSYLSLRKEVIQPHLPVRLPCYDFTPLTKHTFGAVSGTATLLRLHPPYQAYLRRCPPLQVRPATSGIPNSGGVTGGVYKARERIHRAILMRDY